MNDWLEPLHKLLMERSPRERWLLVLGGCAVALICFDSFALRPLQTSADELEERVATLEDDVLRAGLVARQVRQLQAELGVVESRIKPGEKTNLFTLIESLAAHARVKDQLKSIKPKAPSGNARYPETRVEVSLKGATLSQTVRFLYEVERAPMHLIVRSLRIKSLGDKSQLLDVSFSVSSFERA